MLALVWFCSYPKFIRSCKEKRYQVMKVLEEKINSGIEK